MALLPEFLRTPTFFIDGAWRTGTGDGDGGVGSGCIGRGVR